MLTAKELMDLINANAFEEIINVLRAPQTDVDKVSLANILNNPIDQQASPFVKTVHKLPQHQQKWGLVIINMIMAGADVYANYPNSYYTILEHLHLYAESNYFKELSSYLFNNALVKGTIKHVLSLIARNPHLVTRARYSQKKEFYLFLLRQIHFIPDNVEVDYLSTDKESFIDNKHMGRIKLTIEKDYPLLVDLINLCHPRHFTSTVDKRRWHLLFLSLSGRALCIANRRPLHDEKRKSFFKTMFTKGSDVLFCVDQYFMSSLHTLENPGLIALLENKYQINFLSNIETQLSLLLSPLRLTAAALLKTHQSRVAAKKSNASPAKEITTTSETEILTDEEIFLVHKIICLSNQNKNAGLNLLDEKTLSQLKPLIAAYNVQIIPSNRVKNTQALPTPTTHTLNENHFKTLYVTTLGTLPVLKQSSNRYFQKLYITRKDEYEKIDTMENKFNYAINHHLTVCIKDLIENTYFALDEISVHRALFNAILKNNADIMSAIITAKPFLLFSIVDTENRTPWELLISLFEKEDNDLIIVAMKIIKSEFNIPGKTLLPLASAFGTIELIKYLLRQYKDELLASNDLELSFQYALSHHYYDIIVKLIKKEIYFNGLSTIINITILAESLQTALFDVTDTTDLEYFFDLITIKLKKLFIKNDFSINRLFSSQKFVDNQMTPERYWHQIIIQLKFKADSIRKHATESNLNTNIFLQIDNLYSNLFGKELLQPSCKPLDLKLLHILLTDLQPNSNNLTSIKYPIEDIDNHKLPLILDEFFKNMYQIDIQIILKVIQQLYLGIEKPKQIILANHHKVKLLHTIHDLKYHIMHGKKNRIPLLVGLIKLAVKLQSITIDQCDDLLCSLQYLLEEKEFKQIRHYLIRLTIKLGFENQVTTQEFIKNSSPKELDSKRKSSQLINDQRQTSTPNKTALQIMAAKLIAKQRCINQPEFKKQWQDLQRLKPEKQILYAVKLNLNKVLEYLLMDKSHIFNEWDDDLKAALYVAINNNNLSRCATSFIEHLDANEWEILTKNNNNQLSPLALAEKNYNDIVVISILKKILQSNYFSHYSNITHLAIHFKLTQTLKSCIEADQGNVDNKKNHECALLKAFELAIKHQFIAGILIFIETNPAYLNSLQPPLFEELCNLFLQQTNKINNHAQLSDTLNALIGMNQQYQSKSIQYSYKSSTCLMLCNIAIVLVTIRLIDESNFSFPAINNYLKIVNLYFPMPYIYSYLKQLSALLANKIASLDNAKSVKANLSENQSGNTLPSIKNTVDLSLFSTILNLLRDDQSILLNNIDHFTTEKLIQFFTNCILNGNKIDIYHFLYRLSKLDKSQSKTIINVYSAAFAFSVELDLFTLYIDILQCAKELISAFLVIPIYQSCLATVLAQHRYNYLETLLKSMKDSQIPLDLDQQKNICNAIHVEISNANTIKALLHIYQKINTIYKPFISSNVDNALHNNSSTTLIQKFHERLVMVCETATISRNEFELVRSILCTHPDNSMLFLKCLLRLLQLCITIYDFKYIDNQLQQWLQMLSKNQSLHYFHLIHLVQTRISIYEKMSACLLTHPDNTLIDNLLNEKLFPPLVISINDDESIKLSNRKLQLIAYAKARLDHPNELTSPLPLSQSFQIYKGILKKDDFALLESVEQLLVITQDGQLPLNNDQNELCKTIIKLLELDAKISINHPQKLNKLIMVLIQYQTRLFISNFLKNQPSVSIKKIEFNKQLLLKPIRQDSYSDVDRAITSLNSEDSIDSYDKALDNIIHLMSDDFTLNESTIAELTRIWNTLLERIAEVINSLVKNAVITKYTALSLSIDVNSDERFWHERFNAQFGIPPINENETLFFYQKLYKSTLIEYQSHTNLQEQFDYCIKQRLIIPLHEIIESNALSFSYTQLQTALFLARQLKAIKLFILLLHYIDPFDIFTLKDAQEETIWHSINNLPDSEFSAAADIIFANIHQYLDKANINPLTLSISFGMKRFSQYLLQISKSFSETEINSALQTAIYFRDYECVTALIDQFSSKNPNAFKIKMEQFYTYLNDEIIACDSIENFYKLQSKFSNQYHHLRKQFFKSTLFQSKDPAWQAIVDKMSLKQKEFEQKNIIVSPMIEPLRKFAQ